jgi:long-chain acyl-CoA synthetase
VAVEKVEYQIATRLPLALQLFIHGDSVEACLVAVVVPDPDTFPAFVNKILGGDSTITTAVYQDPKLRRAVLKEIALAAQAASLKR